MLEWALRVVKEFGIDGYRVDAPHGKEPNWDRRLPYHASYTSLGVLRLLEQLQAGIKQINPDAVLLCELSGPVFVKMHEFQYDYHLLANLHAMFAGRLTPYEFGEWLRDYWAALPSGAVRVGFTETHDTRVGFPFYAQRGSMAERAMYAILIMAGFIPMHWSGQEAGVEGFYRSVLTTRTQSQALLYGERVFNIIPCGNPDVFSVLCRHPDEIVWGVVSLHAERTPLEFEIARAFGAEPSKHYRLHDLLSGQDWIEYGKGTRTGDELASIPLSLIPFRPYFFKIQPHPDSA
jgi:glycosidase